jgi:hypothetical protein
MRFLSACLSGLFVFSACTVRKNQSVLQSSDPPLGASIFIAACESQGKSDDVLLAKSLMQSVLANDCPSAWTKLQGTTQIMLVGYGLRDVKLLTLFPHVKEVYLNNNVIEDLKPFASLKALKKLNLSFNEISDLRGLGNLSDLSELVLLGNKIEKLTPLVSLPNLKTLDVSENSLQDIAAVGSIKSLASFAASDNAIKDLSPLEGLNDLEQLHIERNQVKSLKPISNLAHLIPKRLKLEGNPLTKEGCPTGGASAAVTSYCLALRGIAP